MLCYNIVYGRIFLSFVEIECVVKFVYIYDFIISLFDGYEMWVGECGFKLFGGEK